jgi:hypothetical protein
MKTIVRAYAGSVGGWLAGILLVWCLPATQGRTWTSNDGHTLDAEEVGYDPSGQTVQLQTANGKVYKIPLSRLGADDQKAAKDWLPPPAIVLDLNMQPPHNDKLDTHSAGGQVISDYSTEQDGAVTVSNMSDYAANITVRILFFDPKESPGPDGHRAIIRSEAHPVQLDSGGKTDLPVSGSGFASVYGASANMKHEATGQWIDGVAVTAETNDGKLITVASTRPEIEDYVKSNFNSVLTEAGGTPYGSQIEVHR